MVTVIITIDLLFCGLCLYIVAMYKELQKNLECIDQNSNVLLINNNDNSFGDCIEFHLAIIRLVKFPSLKKIDTFYDLIAFLHPLYLLLSLCLFVAF